MRCTPCSASHSPAGESGLMAPAGEMWSVVTESPNLASTRAPVMSLTGLGWWSDAEHEAVQAELEAEVLAAQKEAERHGTLIDGRVPAAILTDRANPRAPRTR